MFRGLLFSGLAAVLAVGIVSLILGDWSAAMAQAPPSAGDAQAATAADEWVKNNPPGRTTAQERPVPKDNAHPKVGPEERENLGLPAPTWVAAHGKVQPAVREALGEQRKLMADPKSMAEFQGDRPAGFRGTGYVDVYLRHEPKGKHTSKENQAPVKEVQRRILSKLTAAEFSLIFAFQNTAALVGYVDDAALAKLAGDPDVVAIGLDDQPRPEDPPRARHEPQPPRRHGERPVPIERIANVEVAVYNALEKSSDGYVFVIVTVTRVALDSGPFDQASEKQKAEARRVQDRVLSTLTAEEFRVRTRGALLSGYANAAGLGKLPNHPDVVRVGLSHRLIPAPRDMKNHP